MSNKKCQWVELIDNLLGESLHYETCAAFIYKMGLCKKHYRQFMELHFKHQADEWESDIGEQMY